MALSLIWPAAPQRYSRRFIRRASCWADRRWAPACETYVRVGNRRCKMTSENWLIFTTSLPARSQSTPRVRLWRALRELGAVSLRDGVVVLPATDRNRASLRSELPRLEEASARQRLRKLQRDLESITEIDFFPSGAQAQATVAVLELHHGAARSEGATARDPYRLADARHAGRHQGGGAVRAAVAGHPDRADLDLFLHSVMSPPWPACSMASSRR